MIDENMKIEDNFLGEKEFDDLQTSLACDDFNWYFNKTNEYIVNLDTFQFVHMFYYGYAPRSPFIEKLKPIFEIIKPVGLFRIKANLLTKTSNIIENEFHVDMSLMSEEKQKEWTTSIFYMNTNNGYTKFENGTKVNSVANRMISFPANMKHAGTSCTDERTRVVINFNYFQ